MRLSAQALKIRRRSASLENSLAALRRPRARKCSVWRRRVAGCDAVQEFYLNRAEKRAKKKPRCQTRGFSNGEEK